MTNSHSQKRKLLTALTCFCVLIFAAPAMAVTLSVPDTTAMPGDTVEVLLNIDDGREVAGYQATIMYNPAQIQPVTYGGENLPAVNSSFLNNGQNVFSHIPTPGELRIVSYSDTLENFGGDANGGTVASILFTVHDDPDNLIPGTPIFLDLENVSKSDDQGNGGNATGAFSDDGIITIVTSPRWYFGEGDSANGYQTWLLVVNPNDDAAFLELSVFFENADPVVINDVVAGNSRFTFPMHQLVGPSKFSMQLISTNDVPVFAERAVYWPAGESNRGAGMDFIGSTDLADVWFLAEGTTTSGRETYFLVGNPNSTDAEIQVEYLREGDTVISVPYTVPAQRRLTIAASGDAPDSDFSTRITSTNSVPVVVDRSMKGPANGVADKWGHLALGVTETYDQWLLAEGAVHSSFETFILIANPNAAPVDVQLRFLRAGEAPFIPSPVRVEANSRKTVNVELTYSGSDEMLDRPGFSTEVTALGGEGIVVERAMFLKDGGFTQRSGASAVVGIPIPKESWFLPEGAAHGTSNFETFILVGNPSPTNSDVTVTYFRDNGAPIVFSDVIPAGERKTFFANAHPDIPSDQGTQSFATSVESTNGVPVVAERAMYFSTVAGVRRYEGHASGGNAQ